MPITYGAGASLPTPGTAAYSAAQSGSGTVTAASQHTTTSSSGGGGSSASAVTTSAPATSGGGSTTNGYTNAQIANMTVDQANKAGVTTQYNAMVNGIVNGTGGTVSSTPTGTVTPPTGSVGITAGSTPLVAGKTVAGGYGTTQYYSDGTTSNDYPTNGGGSTTTTTPPATVTTPTVDPNTTALNDLTTKYNDIANQLKDAQQKFSDTITSIQNGSIPLNAGEQAQVDALSASYNDLIAKQTSANAAAAGLANVRGYQTGAAEYDPNFQTRTIGAIASEGQNKLNELQTKKAGALATLTDALKKNDIAVAKEAYDAFTKAETDSASILQNTIKDTQTAIKDANTQAAQNLQAKLAAIILDPSLTLDQKKQALAQGMSSGLLTPAQIKDLNSQINDQESGANNVEVDVNGRKLLVDKRTGTTIKDLGASSTGKATQAEQQTSAIAKYSSAFVPGAKTSAGVPIIDNKGYITPVAFKQAVADAPSEGISRADFIKNFGYLLYADNGKVSSSYGLTNAEQKLVTGALQ